jgi:hypothetical protein
LGDRGKKSVLYLEGLELDSHGEPSRRGLPLEEGGPRKGIPRALEVSSHRSHRERGVRGFEIVEREPREDVGLGVVYPYTRLAGHCPGLPNFVRKG